MHDFDVAPEREAGMEGRKRAPLPFHRRCGKEEGTPPFSSALRGGIAGGGPWQRLLIGPRGSHVRQQR